MRQIILIRMEATLALGWDGDDRRNIEKGAQRKVMYDNMEAQRAFILVIASSRPRQRKKVQVVSNCKFPRSI